MTIDQPIKNPQNKQKKTNCPTKPPRKRVLSVSGRLRGIATRANSCAPCYNKHKYFQYFDRNFCLIFFFVSFHTWSDRSFNCQSETSTQRPLPTSTLATSATSVQQDLEEEDNVNANDDVGDNDDDDGDDDDVKRAKDLRILLCKAAVVRWSVTFFNLALDGFLTESVWFWSASAESFCSELRGTEASPSTVVDSA